MVDFTYLNYHEDVVLTLEILLLVLVHFAQFDLFLQRSLLLKPHSHY